MNKCLPTLQFFLQTIKTFNLNAPQSILIWVSNQLLFLEFVGPGDINYLNEEPSITLSQSFSKDQTFSFQECINIF